MIFPTHTVQLLRRHTGLNNMIKVNVINRLGQEFTITGHIPKAYSIMQGVRTPNRSVQENSFMLRYADNQYSNIKLFSPSVDNFLDIKNITDQNGVILYENPDYNLHKCYILSNIEYKYGDENLFTTSSPHNTIINSLLGKVVVFKNQNIPNIEDNKCLITNVSPTKDEETLQIKLVYGTTKFSILTKVKDIRKTFYFVQPFVQGLEF